MRIYIGYVCHDEDAEAKNLEVAKDFARMYGRKVFKVPGYPFVVAEGIGNIRNPNGAAAERLVDEIHTDMKKARYADKIWLAQVTA